MTKTSPLRRRESMTRFEVDKALFTASEKISSLFYSSAFPKHSIEGQIDLWDLESTVSAILTEAVNEITSVDPVSGDKLSFEIKNRSTLVDDIVMLLLEHVKDAFGPSIEIYYPAPRIISIKPTALIRKKEFIQKEFEITIYETLIGLLRR
ncbi:MAG: hypothetical protein ACUVQ5_01420 [Candidatus Methanomethylicaceae archaeon]